MLEPEDDYVFFPHFGLFLKMALCECEMSLQCIGKVQHICAGPVFSLRNEPEGGNISIPFIQKRFKCGN